QDLRRRAHAESGFRRGLHHRFHPRIRLPAQEYVGRPIRRGLRLQRHRRDRARHGARRARRRLRLGLGELQIAASGLAPRPQGQSAAAGRPRAERRAHPHGRPLGIQIRQERRRPQSGRAGDQPAGVPALLYRAARPAGGAARHAALRLRRHHARPRFPRRRRDHPHRHLAAPRRQGAGTGAEALRRAQGRRRAGAAGDHAVGHPMPAKPTWKELLARGEPLILPCAHDALSARLIERAGFAAYSVGGYALVGARHALPDIGLVAFGEMSAGIRDIMAASSLPVLVDCDDGYGDAKNVARTIAGYEAIGVSAVFMEDQRAPKRCGHMAGKDVIDADAMAAKLRAAVDARRSADFFIIARTDARAVHGLDEALGRAEIYLKAGADGLFIEAPQTIAELTGIGRTFQGVPQLANMLEGGGRTPVLPPSELYRLGFAMVAYPTSLIFRVARAIENALADLKAGRPAGKDESVDF